MTGYLFDKEKVETTKVSSETINFRFWSTFCWILLLTGLAGPGTMVFTALVFGWEVFSTGATFIQFGWAILIAWFLANRHLLCFNTTKGVWALRTIYFLVAVVSTFVLSWLVYAIVIIIALSDCNNCLG